MMRRLANILVWVALVGAPFARAAAPPNPMPPSSITVKRLPNGATVIVRKVPSAPLCVADLWVRAGASDDGGTGAAHALEHMVFKGGLAAPTVRVDAEVEASGAVLSASTLADATHYWASPPPDKLDSVLRSLVDVVREPLLDATAWETERKVILEEIGRSQSDIASETRRALVAKLIPSPVGGPAAGTMEAIKSLQPDTIRGFYRKYYRPDRMVLVIVGNVDPDAAARSAASALSTLSKPSDPSPLETVISTHAGPVEAATESSGAVAVGIAWAAPTGESPALDIACSLLRGRLEQALEAVAVSVEVSHPWQRAGMVIVVAQGAATDRDQIAATLRRAPGTLAARISEASVAAAVLARKWAWWLDLEPPLTQARTLGMAATLGDIEEATLAPEHLQLLNAEDVRTAANGLFNK